MEKRLGMVAVRQYITNLSVAEHKVAPVKINSRGQLKTHVDIFLTLASILGLDDVKQVLVSSFSLQVMWTDPALAWNASDYSGVEFVEVPVGSIWLPDLYLVNSQTNTDIMLHAQQIKVLSNGSVLATACDAAETTCHIDLTKYPYDTQQCNLFVYSFSDFIQITISSQMLDEEVAIVFAQKNEWELLDMTTMNVDLHINSSGSVGFSAVQLVLKRKTLFYTVCLVLPLVVTSYMNTLVFLVPVQSGEKISFVVSIFVSTSVFSSFFTSTMPRGLDTVPGIMVLLIGVIAESSVVLVGTLISMARYHNAQAAAGKADRDSSIDADGKQPDYITEKVGDVLRRSKGRGPKITKVTPAVEEGTGLDQPRSFREENKRDDNLDRKILLTDRFFFVIAFLANSVFLCTLFLK
ncbi:hypothetical protein ACOMHN_026809 [Nucella lapillus]